MKTVQRSLIVAHQEKLLIAELEGAKCAARRHIARAPEVNPVAVPDALQLAFVLARIEIGVGRQARSQLGEPVVSRRDGLLGIQHRAPARRMNCAPRWWKYTLSPASRRRSD